MEIIDVEVMRWDEPIIKEQDVKERFFKICETVKEEHDDIVVAYMDFMERIRTLYEIAKIDRVRVKDKVWISPL